MANELNGPLVSVIVPVYRAEETLRQCLDSLIAQSFIDFEIVLVNDGGTEQDSAICEEYASRDARIVYKRQSNRGLSAARNAGLEIARGCWIMFVDSDDWVDRDFIKKALDAADGADVQMVIFDLLYFSDDKKALNTHRSGLETGVYRSETVLRERLLGNIACYAWNKLYAHELWKDVRFPEGELWEDDAVIHEVIDECENIAVIHDVLYYKHNRIGSLTGNALAERRDKYWVFVQRRRRYNYIRERHPEMLAIENRQLCGAAVLWAASLVEQGDVEKAREISQWLRGLKLPARDLPARTRAARALLGYSPRLFSFLIRTRKGIMALAGK